MRSFILEALECVLNERHTYTISGALEVAVYEFQAIPAFTTVSGSGSENSFLIVHMYSL